MSQILRKQVTKMQALLQRQFPTFLSQLLFRAFLNFFPGQSKQMDEIPCCYRTGCLIYLLAPVLKYVFQPASQLAGSILLQFLLLTLPAFPLQCQSRWITANGCCGFLLSHPPQSQSFYEMDNLKHRGTAELLCEGC